MPNEVGNLNAAPSPELYSTRETSSPLQKQFEDGADFQFEDGTNYEFENL